MKQENVNYFLNIAKAISLKSKDPSTKVGCYIVRKDLTPVSAGYNGFVRGCDESLMTQERPLKYALVVHSEQNAILFARENLTDCIAFITHAPCSRCLLLLVQAGIKEIYFNDIGPIARYGEEELKAIELIIRSNKNLIIKDRNFVDALLIVDQIKKSE